MLTTKNINRYVKLIDKNLFYFDGSLDYERITSAIINMANAVIEYDGDTESMWYIQGNSGECLADIIVGAYWHFTEWHGGQNSQGYVALSALGQIFNPGMSENDVLRSRQSSQTFLALEHFAEAANQA